MHSFLLHMSKCSTIGVVLSVVRSVVLSVPTIHRKVTSYLSNRDRDGHGPRFQAHMRRINQSAGTNITIYHDFHAETDYCKKNMASHSIHG